MKNEIKSIIFNKYSQKYKIESIGIFGSFNTKSNFNDVDIIIFTKAKVYRKESFVKNSLKYDVILSNFENFQFLCKKKIPEWIFIFKEIEPLLDINKRMEGISALANDIYTDGPINVSQRTYVEMFEKTLNSKKKLASSLIQENIIQNYLLLNDLLANIARLWCYVNKIWFNTQTIQLLPQIREIFPTLYLCLYTKESIVWEDILKYVEKILGDITVICSKYEPRSELITEIKIRSTR
ncbi:hypothetical protein ACMAZF_16000 [Psychrobium sp. nBUS_13]|uniref:hypothetical protein n=1 Tax=Psychrobium sp. nBUS_13 TaxID=3395319 RepID=UPI003EBF4CA7